MIDILG